MQATVVVPTGKNDPEFGEQTMASPVQSPLVVGGRIVDDRAALSSIVAFGYLSLACDLTRSRDANNPRERFCNRFLNFDIAGLVTCHAVEGVGLSDLPVKSRRCTRRVYQEPCERTTVFGDEDSVIQNPGAL